MTTQDTMRIVTRPTRLISNGIAISQDAFLVIGRNVPKQFVVQLQAYMSDGLITLRTARLKPDGVKT